ncbi:MAG: hypothetical protein IT581_06285 [Verrucomicrobiales bacterium]|nr:hypothetical protein [Verrucomicrobiales bacterium]
MFPRLKPSAARLFAAVALPFLIASHAMAQSPTPFVPKESKVTGCVYINPTPKRGYDAAVYLWARQSELEGGLESRMLAAVKEWLVKEWPFKKAAFPGRDISWEDWRKIPDEKR